MRKPLGKLLIGVAIFVVVVVAANFLATWLAWRAYVNTVRPAEEFDAAHLPAAPDYSRESAWVVTPESPGLSGVSPGSAQPAPSAAARADVFFIHPTTYFGNENWNADPGKWTANMLVENFVVPSQVSVFSGCCRIYAPRYRQATFHVFMDASPSGRLALEAAFDDVRRAFEHYMTTHNKGRPFILAGHSQGTLHAIRLLEEVIGPADFRKRMIAAYVPGFSLPRDKLGSTLRWLPVCGTAADTRCLIAWDTYGEAGGPIHLGDQSEHYYGAANGRRWERRSRKIATCVNPLSWSAGHGRAGRELHKGATYVEAPGILNFSLRSKLAPLMTKDVAARCADDGYLYISKPTSPVYEFGKLPGENYHVHDYSLFYMNIRDNAVERVNAYLSLDRDRK